VKCYFFRSFSRLRPSGSSCFAKASQDFVAAKDRLDDVRREAGQAKHSGFVFDFAVTSRPT